MREPQLSATDLAAIAEAARQAELRTSGEIVPYLVVASDDYAGTIWKGAALGALVASVGAGLVHWLGGLWGGGVAWITLPSAAGAALGYLLTRWSDGLKRQLTPGEVLDRRVRRRALAAFVEEEVFLTRERTGILLFLALFERRVVVLGDAGIHRRVEAGEWDSIVARLVAAIRAGRLAQGLVEAITACGELLERHGVAVRKDDVDELSNQLRLKER